MQSGKELTPEESGHKTSGPSVPLAAQPAGEEKTITHNLKDITAFNPALIYGFFPESAREANSSSVYKDLHLINQYRDMYKAYYHAQQVILPAIQKQGIANLHAEQVMEWIHELHRFMSRALAKDYGVPEAAGSICKEQLFQWEHETAETAKARMKKLVEELVSEWKSCVLYRSAHAMYVAAVARDFYHGITENHLYFTGNNRLATVMMNIFLCSLGLRSILLRFPGENFDGINSYSQAITHLNDAPELLIAHIHKRLTSEAVYEDSQLAEIFMARMESVMLLEELQKLLTLRDLERLYSIVKEKAYQVATTQTKAKLYVDVIISDELRNKTMVLILANSNAGLRSLLVKLQNTRQAVSPLPQAASVIQRQYTDIEKGNIQRQLEALTGKTGWKFYQDINGATKVRLELGELKENDFDAAKNLAKVLQETNVLKAQVKHTAMAPTNHILVLKNIKPLLLEKVTSLKGITLPTAVESPGKMAEPKEGGLAP